jgi:hypothetical protein
MSLTNLTDLTNTTEIVIRIPAGTDREAMKRELERAATRLTVLSSSDPALFIANLTEFTEFEISEYVHGNPQVLRSESNCILLGYFIPISVGIHDHRDKTSAVLLGALLRIPKSTLHKYIKRHNSSHLGKLIDPIDTSTTEGLLQTLKQVTSSHHRVLVEFVRRLYSSQLELISSPLLSNGIALTVTGLQQYTRSTAAC